MSSQFWNPKGYEKQWKTAHEEVTTGGGKNKAELNHEQVAAAASYEAAQAWEAHQDRQGGKPSSPEKAKELLDSVINAFIDRVVETGRFDGVDKEKGGRRCLTIS